MKDVISTIAPYWQHLIPKHAVGSTVSRDPARPGALRYRHATKGWRSVSKARLAALGVTL